MQVKTPLVKVHEAVQSILKQSFLLQKTMGFQGAIVIGYGEAIRLKAKQDLVDKSNRYKKRFFEIILLGEILKLL